MSRLSYVFLRSDRDRKMKLFEWRVYHLQNLVRNNPSLNQLHEFVEELVEDWEFFEIAQATLDQEVRKRLADSLKL